MPLEHLLIIAFSLFFIALAGLLTHKNTLTLLMFAELMLNASNLALLAFQKLTPALEPQVFILINFAVAAAEAGVGLAILILLTRTLKTLNIGEIKNLHG